MTKISRKNNKSKGILIIIILIFFVGIFAHLYQGFNSEKKSMYLVYNNLNITSDQTGMTLKPSNRFNVSNFDKSYDVKIIPNKKHDFTFTVDGAKKTFCEVSDYSECFNLTKFKNYFVLIIPDDISILQILQKKYSGQTVVIPNDIIYDKDYFKIEVTSSENDINISFLCYIKVSQINIDKTEIKF